MSGQAFEGQRPPLDGSRGDGLETRFTSGHELAVTHGAYATLKLGPRVEELAAVIRDLVPGYRPSDEVTVRLLALSLARIERAAAALEDAEAGELGRLDQDLRRWIDSAARQADKLAMTNTARVRLGLDVAHTQRAVTLTSLADQAEREQLEEGSA